MKKMVLVFALVALAFGGSAFAQGWNSDNIGVYFDTAGTIISNPDASGTFAVHMILSNLSKDVLEGFEAKVVADGGLELIDDTWQLNYDGFEVGRFEGEVMVGFTSPVVPVDGMVHVCSFYVTVINPAVPGALYLEPQRFATETELGEENPVYVSGSVAYPLFNSTEEGLPVLVVNTPDEPVATESTSFDNLKSLYR